ncbi:hypothetical protein B566_EDAN001200 [Ephemera danica]|nr:hypothetical protein B566_EDAN001200 [Ephemera danica]
MAKVCASVWPEGESMSAAEKRLSESSASASLTSNACWTLASTWACCSFSHSCSARVRTCFNIASSTLHSSLLTEPPVSGYDLQQNHVSPGPTAYNTITYNTALSHAKLPWCTHL